MSARIRLAAPIFAAVVCLFLSSGALSEDAKLKRLLSQGVARGYPGMAMIIMGPGGERRSASAGYADIERRRPMRVDDSFHLASITKTFTAVATLRLVDQGKLSLDATLKDVLGDAVARIPYADRITVAQLLDHSSGIYPTNNDMDYLTTVLGPKADPKRVWTLQQMIALADKDRQQPVDAPGAGHHYSDTNYMLLGMIVEKLTGRSLKAQVTRTILQPLGMNATYYYSDRLKGAQGLSTTRTVQGYLLATSDIRSAIAINPMFKAVPGRRKGDAQLLNSTLAAERVDATAGIVSTLPDCAIYARALFGGKLLSPKSQAFLMSAGDGADALAIDRHRTWTMQAMHKSYGVLVYKEGDGPGGVNTLMAYLPAKREIFIGFTNIFGNFDEVDFMMDKVIGPMVEAP